MAQTVNNITQLAYSWLSRLNNAYHDGTSQRILEAVVAADIENERLVQLTAELRSARQTEDTAFKRLSDRDFTSDDLKAADELQDAYMSTIHLLLLAQTHLPRVDADEQATVRRAQELAQTFRDFHFQRNEGFEAESRRIVNMMQAWTARQEDCQALGVWPYMQKAQQAAQRVLSLTGDRVAHDMLRVKGELAAARRATDQAVAGLYQLLNAMAVLSPGDKLTSLMATLSQIQQRAEQYYIGTAKPGEAPEPEPQPAAAAVEGSDGGPA